MDSRKLAADQASRTIQLAYQAQSAAQQAAQAAQTAAATAAQAAQAAQSVLSATQEGFVVAPQAAGMQQPIVQQPWQ